MSKVIRIDGREIRDHLNNLARGAAEDTLNTMLDAEADEICKSYERSPVSAK